MPDGDPRDFVCLRTCLVFWEAVTWIARRDFSIPANRIGPRPLNILPVWGDEEDEDDNGRYELAHELLMDRAAKGKIRLYARGGSSELVDEKSISFPMELSPELIKKAEYVFEEEGPTLYIAEQEAYGDVVVDYSDLIREFWGESGRECDEIVSKQPRPATLARPNPKYEQVALDVQTVGFQCLGEGGRSFNLLAFSVLEKEAVVNKSGSPPRPAFPVSYAGFRGGNDAVLLHKPDSRSGCA